MTAFAQGKARYHGNPSRWNDLRGYTMRRFFHFRDTTKLHRNHRATEMGWFGKKNISARDASVQFVEATMIATIQQWPTLVTHLREGLLADTTFLDDRWTQFEFAMAAMVIQAQAVENLISAEAAARVKQHMRDSLGAVEETGEAAIDAFDAYEYAVARASVTMNMFPDEIAILLCHRCNAPRVASNPLSISVLSLELIQVNLG